jgi:hypothetical protein
LLTGARGLSATLEQEQEAQCLEQERDYGSKKRGGGGRHNHHSIMMMMMIMIIMVVN